MRFTQRVHSRNTWPGYPGTLMIAALLMVAVVIVHTAHFADRNYREDELNMIHAEKTWSASGVVQWTMLEGFHPPGWSVFATQWIAAFGQHESIVRYSSTLLTLLMLALVFRLGTDLFDRQVGLIAMLIIGALPFYQFYGHELRPYAMLALSGAGMQVALLRWLRRQSLAPALVYVGFGIVALQTHYFALYFVAAHLVTLLVLARVDRVFYIRALGLFAALGLSFVPSALSIIHGALVSSEGGISYGIASDWQGIVITLQDMQGLPLLLLPVALIPVATVYPFYRYDERYALTALRGDPEWRRWLLLVPAAVFLIAAFAGNLVLSNLTPRNLMIVVPNLAVLTSFAVRAFGARIRLAGVLAFAAMGVFIFHAYAPHIPYRQMTDFIADTYEPGDRVVTGLDHHGIAAAAVTYYLLDWPTVEISQSEIFHFADPRIHTSAHLPEDVTVHQTASTETLRSFEAFLAGARRVFLIAYTGPPLYEDTPLTGDFLQLLAGQFEPVRQQQWALTMPDSAQAGDASYTVIEYRRKGGAQ